MCYTVALDTGFFTKEQTEKFFETLNENGFIFGSFTGNNRMFIKTFLDSVSSKEKISGIIADFIFEAYVKRCFLKAVDEVYYYFDENEKNEIFASLDKEKDVKYISGEVLKYIGENNFIEIKGFADFRITDFLNGVFDAAEVITDEYLEKKEYLEFVKLLKYFLDVQNSECERVDVFKNKNGEYVLIDENKNKIPLSDCEVSVEIADEILDVYDILLSELINLAPKKVVIHNKNMFENKEILKTIENIFENNVSYCTGCDLCAEFENENKNENINENGENKNAVNPEKNYGKTD